MSGQLIGFLVSPFESFGFMRIALVACFALALANGPIGTLLLMRRESLGGNVLSHAVMPGAALGFLYAGYSLAALTLGGVLTGLAVAGSFMTGDSEGIVQALAAVLPLRAVKTGVDEIVLFRRYDEDDAASQ